MEKIKVTATLKDGRISVQDGYLPLDGILYSAYGKKYFPELQGLQMRLEDAIDFPLPIAKIGEESEDWYYDCSFAMFNILKEDRRLYNKRFDETLAETYLDKPKVIETRRGKFKNYRNALDIVLTKEITWYLTGDKKEIQSLLEQIHSLGKKRSQGIGIVKEWTVESTRQDLSHLRAIPCKNGTEEMAIRPLYFYSKNIRKVVMPNDNRLGYMQIYGG